MRLTLAIAVLLLRASAAHAWDTAGHQIVAELAEQRLSPAAHDAIAGLLAPGETLASVASWADDYRKQCANTGPWHYVNIPLDAKGYDAARDCPDPRGCVVSSTERELASLADTRQSADDRSRALRLVVHFIGDLHQPLHAGDRSDRGGNDLRVRFVDRLASLHGVWDHELIAWTGRSVADYVGMLMHSLRPAEARQWARGSVRDWVVESQRVARRAYGKLPKPSGDPPLIELGDSYAKAMLTVLDQQLLRAGVRLAAALDRAFERPGPEASLEQLTAAQACTPAPRAR